LGKSVRFGPIYSAQFAATTTGTSTGSVDSSHDSFTPIGGMVAIVQMQLGEIDPGGIGAGLYFMLVSAIIAVFIAGLTVVSVRRPGLSEAERSLLGGYTTLTHQLQGESPAWSVAPWQPLCAIHPAILHDRGDPGSSSLVPLAPLGYDR
jgi:hypothetical protein